MTMIREVVATVNTGAVAAAAAMQPSVQQRTQTPRLQPKGDLPRITRKVLQSQVTQESIQITRLISGDTKKGL